MEFEPSTSLSKIHTVPCSTIAGGGLNNEDRQHSTAIPSNSLAMISGKHLFGFI